MDEATLLRWARRRSGDPKELMPNECLMHLVRRALREGKARPGNQLLQILLERCTVLVKEMLSGGSVASSSWTRRSVASAYGEHGTAGPIGTKIPTGAPLPPGLPPCE
jgi:hypothetical protein